MKKSQNQFNAPTSSDQRRRDFLSLSLMAGGTLLLAGESQAQTPASQSDDAAIPSTVSLADSLALYTDLLEDVRRLVLQKDAQKIFVAKFEATEWLGETGSRAAQLRALLENNATLPDRVREELTSFLWDVVRGGRELREGLILMREQPLEEIKNLDTDFDKIRAQMALASNAMKNGNLSKAKEGIASAIRQLDKYTPTFAYNPGAMVGNEPAGNALPEREDREAARPLRQQPFKPVSVPASSLAELLQIVLEQLNATPASRPSNQHHSRGAAAAANYYASAMVEPALQNSITGVLRSRLNPSSWLQRAIGYAVAFPILLRVSDKNNRVKLLNDALRLVPPGLRNPLLEQLARDLANLN